MAASQKIFFLPLKFGDNRNSGKVVNWLRLQHNRRDNKFGGKCVAINIIDSNMVMACTLPGGGMVMELIWNVIPAGASLLFRF